MRILLVVAVYMISGCSSPTAPTPPQPSATTPPSVTPPPVTITPPTDPRFDLTFFRQFAEGSVQSQPGAPLIPTKRWERAPRVYLRTVDERGIAMEPSLLDQTAATIINGTSAWAGNAFGLADLERGTETRAGQSGWITVAWATSLPNLCGQTNLIGAEGTTITLSRDPACHCGSFVTLHELGHAMGYYHTDGPSDVMYAGAFSCSRALSAREQYHAQVVYGLPVGTRF